VTVGGTRPSGHGRAVALMVGVTLLWSIAGVVTRHLEAARSFEVTFWRSGFNALALGVAITAMRGTAAWSGLRRASWPVWVSGLCWAVMFTAFMVALTLTAVANVLITMAIAPLVTALFARLFLHHRLATRTWVAIAVAGAGIAWMFGRQAEAAGDALLGTAVALAVPLAAAVNWCVLQHVGRADPRSGASETAEDFPAAPAAPPEDMLPSVFLGALLSALITAPLAWPLQAGVHDLGLLALLGVVQLAVPCLVVVRVARVLPAPELALLSLLEVVFGVAWAWLGAGERPPDTALAGGALVLGALVATEGPALRRSRRAPGGAADEKRPGAPSSPLRVDPEPSTPD
jgi:drug/metabolite transporter (DMT)-like permease